MTVATAPYLPTTVEVCRTIGVTYRRVDYWIRRGLLTPSNASSGSGSVRRWTPDDVADVILLTAIVDVLGPGSAYASRPALDVARDLLEYWRSEGRPACWLVVFDGGVGHVDDPADATDLLDLGHGLAIFPTPDKRGTR